MINVYATLSQLKYSFDELKAVSVTGIWNNVKKKKRFPRECQQVGRDTLEHSKPKNAFINSKEQAIKIWTIIT